MLRFLILALSFAIAGCQTQTVATQSWIDTANQNGDELLSLQAPTNWQPFKDYSLLLRNELKYLDSMLQPSTEECVELWVTPGKITHNNDRDFARCYKKIFDEGYAEPRHIKKLLIAWAEAESEPLSFRTNPNDSNPDAYQKQSILGEAAYWYALNYNHPKLALSQIERAAIEQYLVSRLLNEKFPRHELNGKTDCRGYVTKPEKLPANADTNTCGSTRWKVSLGEVSLGLRLGNQELLSKGNRDLFVNLSMIDSDGIYVPYAARGSKAYGYYREVPHFMSHFVELYKSVGFDFLEYQLPHGKTVKEFYDMAYRILGEDFHIMDKYARLNIGALSYPFRETKNMPHEEFTYYTKSCNCGSFSFEDGYFYAMNPEYMKRYRSSEVPKTYRYKDDTDFFIANAMSLHLAFK